ncbi:pyruvate dehydrogenase E1 component subunit alpha [Sphaerisporangium melleum]|uniref:Pyruvate dehydrogenase E1 component subunit alpha n=1 Tax=Sphaerisporangium melleum TaxID=321316 RepID=A0A917VHJ7_9ACTN|nr:pyruvate dehydrogenase (acetyl-transferring) E1 component subunit alpha [Sphaerisporangium melleum]GGK78113.1 pyruvate dehydrogenase E1 component subunit alpha [Sphaerisporangium melleum]GII71935.1 pyruvate dehydrogenase E1 component subunit alpha [Sphaerisporangium melleum]
MTTEATVHELGLIAGDDPRVRRVIGPTGRLARPGAAAPAAELCLELYRRMVAGRRLDQQATALAKQGRLTVYPSSQGQEACQIGAVVPLSPGDWLFPTYRDCVAVMARGVDPVEALTLMRGDRHCGYDPYLHRVAPQTTPLATQAVHAAGLAHAARLRGDSTVALALIGDGATSEGDFHEACNFAAVFRSPVVFLIQNNQYAISVPLSRQTAAKRLADKAIGYGMAAHVVDGNDAVAVAAVVAEALTAARAGQGPCLIEALTYRVGPHTNSDDPARYRTEEEVEPWRRRDPLARLRTHLRGRGLLDDAGEARVGEEAERLAADLRRRMEHDEAPEPGELFAHVFAEPTPRLRRQAEELRRELDGARPADGEPCRPA